MLLVINHKYNIRWLMFPHLLFKLSGRKWKHLSPCVWNNVMLWDCLWTISRATLTKAKQKYHTEADSNKTHSTVVFYSLLLCATIGTIQLAIGGFKLAIRQQQKSVWWLCKFPTESWQFSTPFISKSSAYSSRDVNIKSVSWHTVLFTSFWHGLSRLV